MQGREPWPQTEAALQQGLELGQRDVGRRLDDPHKLLLVPGQSGRAVAADLCRHSAARLAHRCISLIAADALTAKHGTTSRIELPPSTARTIRSRRAVDKGAGITSTRRVESPASIPCNRKML
jgi:hypothetical protein